MRKPTRSIKGGRPFRLPRRRFARRALAAAFGWLIAPAVSHAAVYTYFGPSGAFGLWSNAGSWSPAAVPPSGSDVVLGSGNAASGVIFNQTYTTALNSLTINATIPATFTVVQNVSGSAMLALTETLGTTVYGNLYNQSAGTNTTNNLSIGAASSYANTYLLSGSGALYGTNETIGAGTSTGAFQQFGGTNTVNSLLAIGTMATTSTPSNVYNMTGGTLTVNGNLTAGSGSFQQSAGSTTITGLMSLQGYSTASVGGSAVLNLTGSLSVGNEPANAGAPDTDTYFQTGGIANLSGGMVVGNGNQVSGVMTITGGTLNLQTGTLALGQGLATATANQSGGNVTVGTLQIANGSSGTANWFLSGNTPADNICSPTATCPPASSSAVTLARVSSIRPGAMSAAAISTFPTKPAQPALTTS